MENRALLIAALFVGAMTAVLLLVDAVTGSIEARAARGDDDLRELSERRVRDLAWTIAITAVLSTGIAFTVDSLIRSAVNVHGDTLAVLGLLGATSGVVFVVGVVGSLAAVRRERPGYARIRAELRDRDEPSLDPGELRALQTRLARADRVRERRFSTSGLLRTAGLAIVVAVAIGAVVVSVPISGRALDVRPLIAAIGSLVVAIVSYVVGVRAARVRRDAVEEVLTEQREEVVALLERGKIPARAPVPGLSRRVSRALAILREQQK